jgi:SAM-dependent methyltransferase
MVTLPTPQGPAAHEHRDIAEGFGDNADAYDRARPRYPDALAQAVVATLPGRSIVDVGIGTGLSSLPFRDADCTVLGVEPDPRMAAIARRRGFAVEEARFEDWDSRGRYFDGIIAGQTWHWIDPIAGATKAADALVDGGRLVLFWNAGDPPADVAKAFGEIYESINTGLPYTPWTAGTSAATGYSTGIDTTADSIAATHRYGEPERFRFDWQATITRDDWALQIPTVGGHNRIPAAELNQLISRMSDHIESLGGSFTMSYSTVGLTVPRIS